MATLILQPDETTGEDTSLIQNIPTNNYGSSSDLWAGNFNASAGNARRALIRFDISALPVGATITAASLALRTNAIFPAATAHNVTVHRALTQWFETGSTWNLRNTSGSVAWASGAGGGASDRAATPTATVSVGAANTTYNWNVLADVQAWYGGSAQNYGWWILAPEGSGQIQKVFNSSGDPTPSDRPTLTITYTPAPTSNMEGTAAGSASASGTLRAVGYLHGNLSGVASASGTLIDLPKGKGNQFEDDVLNLILNGIAIANIADNASTTPLEDLYISLHTGTVEEMDDQATNEADYVGYSRIAVPRDGTGWDVIGGVGYNAAPIEWGAGAGGTNMITYVCIGTEASGPGQVLFYGEVVFPLEVIIGTVPRFEIGELQVIED